MYEIRSRQGELDQLNPKSDSLRLKLHCQSNDVTFKDTDSDSDDGSEIDVEDVQNDIEESEKAIASLQRNLNRQNKILDRNLQHLY